MSCGLPSHSSSPSVKVLITLSLTEKRRDAGQARDGPSSWWSDNNEESVLWGKLWASGTSISAWLPGLAPGETDSELQMFFPSEIRPMNGLYIMNEIILKSTAHVTTSFNVECFCSCLICASTQQTLLVKLFPCERSQLSLVGYFYWEAEKNKAPSVLRLDITPQNGKGIQPNMLI